MNTKSMLTEMLYRSGVEKTALKAEIAALKMVHVADRKRIDDLKSDLEPDSKAVQFAIKWARRPGSRLSAIAILRRISRIGLKEAKDLIDEAWEGLANDN